MISRRLNFVARHKTAVVTMVIGLIAGPIVGVMFNDYIAVTPKRLAGILEDDKVSISERALNMSKDSPSISERVLNIAGDRVSEFNKLRKEFRQPITLENIDLFNKTLSGVNLDSVVILHSNLSRANLEMLI